MKIFSFKLNSIDPDEIWCNQQKQEKIRNEILDLDFSVLDYLIDVNLIGNKEMQPIAEEIVDFILVGIEPNWKT